MNFISSSGVNAKTSHINLATEQSGSQLSHSLGPPVNDRKTTGTPSTKFWTTPVNLFSPSIDKGLAEVEGEEHAC